MTDLEYESSSPTYLMASENYYPMLNETYLCYGGPSQTITTSEIEGLEMDATHACWTYGSDFGSTSHDTNDTLAIHAVYQPLTNASDPVPNLYPSGSFLGIPNSGMHDIYSQRISANVPRNNYMRPLGKGEPLLSISVLVIYTH